MLVIMNKLLVSIVSLLIFTCKIDYIYCYEYPVKYNLYHGHLLSSENCEMDININSSFQWNFNL